MIELTADCFNDICNDGPVREQLGSLDTNRGAAVRRFWLWVGLAIPLGAAAFFSLFRAGWIVPSFVAPIAFVGIGIAIGSSSLKKVSEGLKQPVLQALAAKAGLEYLE